MNPGMPMNKVLNSSEATEISLHAESSASFVHAAVSNWFSAAVPTTNFEEVHDETTSESTLRNTPDASSAMLSDGVGTPKSSITSQCTPGHQTPAKNTRRKGHTKSRLGCYNCKRRRIKVYYVTSLLVPARELLILSSVKKIIRLVITAPE